MRKTLLCTLFALISATPAWAAAPSDESITQLLTLQEIDRVPALVQMQIEEMTAHTAERATMGRTPTADEARIIKSFEQKSDAVQAELESRLSVEKLKSDYVRIYKEIFTQEEVDQLIALYQTPVGKMLAEKMPLVNQRTMSLIQQSMTPVLHRLQQASSEMTQQLIDLRSGKAPVVPSP